MQLMLPTYIAGWLVRGAGRRGCVRCACLLVHGLEGHSRARTWGRQPRPPLLVLQAQLVDLFFPLFNLVLQLLDAAPLNIQRMCRLQPEVCQSGLHLG